MVENREKNIFHVFFNQNTSRIWQKTSKSDLTIFRSKKAKNADFDRFRQGNFDGNIRIRNQHQKTRRKPSTLEGPGGAWGTSLAPAL